MAALGNIFDDITELVHSPDTFYEKQCPAGSQVVAMREMIDDLDRTWVTTGYYTWQEMGELIAATIKLAGLESSAALDFFHGNSTDEMKATVRKALDRYNTVAEQALDYTQTWQKAKQTGVLINAPGLRAWVIKDLRAAADLARALEIANCQSPWWLGVVTGILGAFIAVGNIAKRIGKTIAKIGEVVLDAADTALGLWPIVKWGAVGLGVVMAGVWAWGKVERSAEAGRRPFDWSKLNPLPRIKGLVRRPSPPISGYRRRRRRRR